MRTEIRKRGENPLEKRIPLATPTMHGDEIKYINEAFEKNWVAPLGFNCDGFEKEMAEYLSGGEGECNALSLVSGTAALHLAIKLAGIKAGDIVLCSDMTFAATANPISYEGAVQVYIDSEEETWNMDPKALEKAFEKYPEAKAVMLPSAPCPPRTGRSPTTSRLKTSPARPWLRSTWSSPAHVHAAPSPVAVLSTSTARSSAVPSTSPSGHTAQTAATMT